MSLKARIRVLEIWVHLPQEEPFLTYSKHKEEASKEKWKKPQDCKCFEGKERRRISARFPQIERWLGGGGEARLGESLCSKLFHLISVREEQLTCYSTAGIL